MQPKDTQPKETTESDKIFNQTKDIQEMLAVKALTDNYQSGDKITVGKFEFHCRIYKLFDKFDDFDWTNVYFAGGLLAGLLENKYDPELYKKSDIDLFVYGKNKGELVKNLIKVYSYFKTKMPSAYAFKYCNSYVITIISHEFDRPIQLIGISQKIDDIIKKFDLTSCQVAFNGDKLIYTDDFLKTMISRKAKIMSNSISLYRIIKCIQRGYSIIKCDKQPYIKNTFHTYVFDEKTGRIINTDKYWHLNEINNQLDEIMNNDIVKQNLYKTYIPLSTESHDDVINNIKKFYSDQLEMIENENSFNNMKTQSFDNVFK